MDIKKYLFSKKQVIDEALNRYLPSENEYPQVIHEAMRYSVFGDIIPISGNTGESHGGKRLRPILTLASAEAVSKEILPDNLESLLPVAVALELIHAYSLIHDDLPALDNDDYRRGILSCHKRYGEAIAILTGDALLTHAFYLILSSKGDPSLIQKAGKEIAFAISTFGMIGGQVVDILSENSKDISYKLQEDVASLSMVEATTLQYIHTHKTGALLTACVKIGCILSGGSESQLNALTQYGEHIGLAFQIVDDILDVTQIDNKGKKGMSDIKKKKLTYAKVYGINESKEQIRVLIKSALSCLNDFGQEAEPLRDIARFVGERQY